jgi:hypothetical protein
MLFRCIDFLILTKSVIMEITYELTQRDFRDSIIAHRNPSKSSKWSYRVLAFIFLLGLGINLVGIAMQCYRRKPATKQMPARHRAPSSCGQRAWEPAAKCNLYSLPGPKVN